MPHPTAARNEALRRLLRAAGWVEVELGRKRTPGERPHWRKPGCAWLLSDTEGLIEARKMEVPK